MKILAGTSGFSYDGWRGSFYPRDLDASVMLGFYAQRLPTVEINNTFYRMPRPDVLAGWADQTPKTFVFTLKATRRITHQLRLENAEESVSHLFKVAAILEQRLGPVLFQLPPFLRKDAGKLRDFLGLLPEGCLAAFEFRHPSWFDDEVFETLRAHNAALCTGDVDDAAKSTPLVATASWGYLRLRRSDYAEPELVSWAERIFAQPWSEAYAYFKHEVRGPELAARLNSLAGEAGPGLVKAPAPPPAAELEPAAEPAARPGVTRAAPPRRARRKAKKLGG
jgi:uncharacterized protein YecE (DUF72 family)